MSYSPLALVNSFALLLDKVVAILDLQERRGEIKEEWELVNEELISKTTIQGKVPSHVREEERVLVYRRQKLLSRSPVVDALDEKENNANNVHYVNNASMNSLCEHAQNTENVGVPVQSIHVDNVAHAQDVVKVTIMIDNSTQTNSNPDPPQRKLQFSQHKLKPWLRRGNCKDNASVPWEHIQYFFDHCVPECYRDKVNEFLEKKLVQWNNEKFFYQVVDDKYRYNGEVSRSDESLLNEANGLIWSYMNYRSNKNDCSRLKSIPIFQKIFEFECQAERRFVNDCILREILD